MEKYVTGHGFNWKYLNGKLGEGHLCRSCKAALSCLSFQHPVNLENHVKKRPGQLDAYVLCCALNNNCPMVSLDAVLVAAARKAGIEVIEVIT